MDPRHQRHMNDQGYPGHLQPDYPGGSTASAGHPAGSVGSHHGSAGGDNQRPISPAHSPAHSQKLGDLLRQKDSEIHLLRMNVTDKDTQIKKLKRDLDHCHEQIRHLNTTLMEKKENILGYQEQIGEMRAELAQLRDNAMCAQGQGRESEAERALHMQVEKFSRENSDLRRQLAEQRHHMQSPARAYNDPSELENLYAQREQASRDLDAARRKSLDLKTTVETLEVQVAIYKEDFHSERSDRERAQAELLTLKEERESLKQAINMLATEHGIRLGPTGLPLPRT